jgi:hypothetical protein
VVVTYWPRTFTVGLVLALVAAVALALALVIAWIKTPYKPDGN